MSEDFETSDHGWQINVLSAAPDELARPATTHEAVPDGWVWIDVFAPEGTVEPIQQLLDIGSDLELDALAVLDVLDKDLPKFDDFEDHLLVVLHGLSDDEVETYEVDCFLTATHLLTVRVDDSPSIGALWEHVQRNADLAAGGPDELLARLADVLTRRHMSVVDVFDDLVDALTIDALAAKPTVLGDLTAIRADLSTVRRIVSPQREVLDLLRRSSNPLISASGRRRFADGFDIASRAAQGLDTARTALSEVLDAYRGAEARKATEVTKVLTVYAAIMLPLSLIAGIFGMNFPNLPALDSDRGWLIAVGLMAIVTAGSLAMFVALGWIRRPSGRAAGYALGRGLIEAASAPAKLVGTAFQVIKVPLRSVRDNGNSTKQTQ